jgi:hypothetical protein
MLVNISELRNVGINQLMPVSTMNCQLVPFASWKIPPGFSIHSQMHMTSVTAVDIAKLATRPNHKDFSIDFTAINSTHNT